MYQGFTLAADEVLALPVDELALAVLADVIAADEWNSHNWLLAAQQGYRNEPVLRALAEAWEWLRAKGLVARQPGQTSADTIFVTRLGHQVAEQGPSVLLASERLTVALHHTLERKVRRQFLMGEYELAAFAALRQVEIAVRTRIGAPESLVGVKLMRQAFGENGSLRLDVNDPGEQEAFAHLYAGAVGFFKNPTSHREVRYDDPTEAAEVVLFADLLLRMLDRRADVAGPTATS